MQKLWGEVPGRDFKKEEREKERITSAKKTREDEISSFYEGGVAEAGKNRGNK